MPIVEGMDITVRALNPYLKDADISALVAAVDLDTEIEALTVRYPCCICDDNTSITSPGVIDRAIRIQFSATFSAAFPTQAQQLAMLRDFAVHAIRRQLNAQGSVTLQTWAFGPVNCPATCL